MTPVGWLSRLATGLFVLAWTFFRIGELIPVLIFHSTPLVATLLASAVLLGGFGRNSVPPVLSILLTLAALTFVMDSHVPDYDPPTVASRPGTVVITGANSGVGLEAAVEMGKLGSTVIMACRSTGKCETARTVVEAAARDAGNGGSAECRYLDLSDPKSIRRFATGLKQDGVAVDVLHNNAGLGSPPGGGGVAGTLEPLFAVMHLGHFLLTELMVAQADGRPLRVVATSSGTHHLCALPYFLVPEKLHDGLVAAGMPRAGCIDQEFLQQGVLAGSTGASYYIAKLANTMHVLELPRRHPGQVTAVGVDLGWVQTTIQPWMSWTINPSSLGMMRRVADGVRPVVRALTSDLPDQDKHGVMIDTMGNFDAPLTLSQLGFWHGPTTNNTEANAKLLWEFSAEWAKTAGL